ncbi:MAG: glycosyltransferase [Planctomycetota bacterium]|jgi:glycosyltransferase involved in cell wall biosynthesis
MMEDSEKRTWQRRATGIGDCGPLVTVLLPTFNRRRYFSQALASVLAQSYNNLQIIVVNDGGEDVSDIVSGFDDQRVVLIDRKDNRGKAFSLNQALDRAKGKYVAYIDDDDLYYPNHVEALLEVLEGQTDCRVAYSDLYKVCCKVLPDQSRVVLSKVVEVSRDFDRFVVLYFNNVFHVSLMHRRDLIEKTGPYNEQLNVLIDWDMTRRLAFFSDFRHIHEITGEYYMPVGDCDRISVQRRKDKSEFARNALTIRTTRPAKPWPKIEDMSIVFIADKFGKEAGRTLGSIWRYTFYPYKLYLPLPQSDLDKLNTQMPNIVSIPVDPASSQAQRLDAALAHCDGEFITVVPSGFNVRQMWVEDCLYALINSPAGNAGYELEDSTDTLWGAVLRRSDLQHARRSLPNLGIRQSLQAAGVVRGRIRPEQIAFQFDQLLEEARRTGTAGDWAKSAEIFEYIGDRYDNQLWMKSLAASAFFSARNYGRAAPLISQVNNQRPTVDTLLLEARLKRQEEDFHSAIELLEKAEQTLEGKELVWT